ncbi:hypothetical protein EZV62_005674 [Acer yangbiense]|uniref:Uncharacterized protein n=1 Tax=Acer yangbiense TaxID=1000413 RepID=A0A5C7INT3_9ROSI|nr:hypothetical protein EZV62_005674 [Acer yangbiense]
MSLNGHSKLRRQQEKNGQGKGTTLTSSGGRSLRVAASMGKGAAAAMDDKRGENRRFQQLHNCMLFRNLSENLPQQIKKYKGSVWKETKGVSVKGIDAVKLLSDLSKDLKKKIKHELCLESLKKLSPSTIYN